MTNTILLADDSVTIQKVIELTFMDQDYEVVAVGDGDEALERLEQIDPDVVIADVHMPGASGYDVARRSKQLHPSSPVLVLVGTFEPFDEAEVEAAGADGYLKKPFDSQELLQRVAELLAVREETGEEAGQQAAAEEAEEDAAEVAGGAEPEAAAGAWAPSKLESEAAAWAPPGPEPDAEEGSGAAPWAAWDDEETGPLHGTRPDAGAGAPDADAGVDDTRADAWGVAAGPSGDTDEPTFDETSDRRRGWQPSAAETSFEPGALEAADERSLEAGGEREPTAEPSGEDTSWVPSWQAPPAAERETGRAAAAPDEDEPFPDLARPPAPPAAPEAEPAAAPPAGPLSDDDVDRVARRVAELLGEQVVREVAWEVVPDLAEVVIKDRLRELESQLD